MKKDNQTDNESKDLVPKQDNTLIPAEEVVSGIIDLVYNIGFQEKSNIRKARTLWQAFVLYPEHIEKIESIVNEKFESLQSIPKDSLSFHGIVGYSDMTTEAFPSLKELMDHAGHRKTPIDFTMSWKALLIEPPLKIAYIQIDFHTDKKKDIDSFEFLDFPLAHIEYEIGGVNRAWVEDFAQDIEPILDAIKMKGIYKPLLVFRSKTFVYITAWALAALAEISVISFISQLYSKKSNSEYLQSIVNSSNITDKINELSKYFLSDKPIMVTLIPIAAGILILLIVVAGGYHLLPKLVPRSGVLIGLEKTRFQVYQNAFKFLVFTIGFGGIGVAIIIEIIKAIFK
jgi:hypothetical protein